MERPFPLPSTEAIPRRVSPDTSSQQQQQPGSSPPPPLPRSLPPPTLLSSASAADQGVQKVPARLPPASGVLPPITAGLAPISGGLPPITGGAGAGAGGSGSDVVAGGSGKDAGSAVAPPESLVPKQTSEVLPPSPSFSLTRARHEPPIVCLFLLPLVYGISTRDTQACATTARQEIDHSEAARDCPWVMI